VKKQVLISIDDSHIDRISTVVEKLEGEGLEVSRSMPALGVVSGTADEARVPSLRDVEGVLSIEEERRIEIPPPDSPIQ
jgi:hypothetical protein